MSKHFRSPLGVPDSGSNIRRTKQIRKAANKTCKEEIERLQILANRQLVKRGQKALRKSFRKKHFIIPDEVLLQRGLPRRTTANIKTMIFKYQRVYG